MQAIRIHDYGDRSVLQHEIAPDPTLLPDDVIIRVHAAGVNPADWQFRRGDFRQFAPLKFPAILGWDVAGTIERVGTAVRSATRPGDRVYAMCDMSRDGAYAELVAVNHAHVAPAPRSLPLSQCAAVPLAALTAWQALFDIAQVKVGHSVLVTAAAGSVGQFAVQFARAAGVQVTAVASAASHDWLRALGAQRCVDYSVAGWENGLRDFDAVLDGAGGATRDQSWSVLRPGGMLVAIAMPPADPASAAARGYRAATAAVAPNGARLREIATLIDRGALKVSIDSTYALDEVAAAHARSESRRARGKVLLRIAAVD